MPEVNDKSDSLKGEFILKEPAVLKHPTPAPSSHSKTKKSKFTNEPHHSTHFYSSLATFPDGVVLQNQDEDEEIVLLVRRHFVTNFPWITISILLSIIPVIITPFLPQLVPFIQIIGLTRNLFIGFYYLLLLGYILINFSLWYFHVSLITTKRIVDVDVTGILFRNVAETKLDLIQDVSYTQNGVLRSVFNYGDIFIQTAGNLPNFEFEQAPQPAEIIRLLSDLLSEVRSKPV